MAVTPQEAEQIARAILMLSPAQQAQFRTSMGITPTVQSYTDTTPVGNIIINPDIKEVAPQRGVFPAPGERDFSQPITEGVAQKQGGRLDRINPKGISFKSNKKVGVNEQGFSIFRNTKGQDYTIDNRGTATLVPKKPDQIINSDQIIRSEPSVIDTQGYQDQVLKERTLEDEMLKRKNLFL